MRWFAKCRPTLFVSWSGEHARQLAAAIRQYFLASKSTLEVFLSDHISHGEPWQDVLKRELNAAKCGLVLFTPNAVDSDWTLHEAAVLSQKRFPIEVMLVNCPRVLLPEPLKSLQVTEFSVSSLQAMINRFASGGIAKYSEEAFARLQMKLEEIDEKERWRYVTNHEIRWASSFERPWAISRQNGSPFGLEQILRTAKKRAILVAQNHSVMTLRINDAPERFWGILESHLQRGVDIDIVAMHPDVGIRGVATADTPAARRLWALYMQSDAFEDHLEQCWQTLREWATKFDSLQMVDDRVRGKFRV